MWYLKKNKIKKLQNLLKYNTSCQFYEIVLFVRFILAHISIEFLSLIKVKKKSKYLCMTVTQAHTYKNYIMHANYKGKACSFSSMFSRAS